MSSIEKVTISMDGMEPITMTPAQMRRATRMLAKRERTEGQVDLEDIAGPGHNGPETAQWGNIAADRLRSLVERIERLEEERKALSCDIKDIYLEARSAGFDQKVLRALIAIRRKEPAEVEEAETLLDVYRRALGMP